MSKNIGLVEKFEKDQLAIKRLISEIKKGRIMCVRCGEEKKYVVKESRHGIRIACKVYGTVYTRHLYAKYRMAVEEIKCDENGLRGTIGWSLF